MPSVTGITKAYGDGTYGGVVVHGATAAAARPASLLFVHWIGSVAPTNAASGDEWTDTASSLVKRYNGSAWVILGTGVYSVGRAADATGIVNNTMVPDTVLSIPNVQPGSYEIAGLLIYDVGLSDAKFGWVTPAGTFGTWTLGAPGSSATSGTAANVAFMSFNYNSIGASLIGGGVGIGAANSVAARPLGSLTVVTAGTVQVQYAQQTTDAANALTVRAGSYIRLTRTV